MFAQVVMPDKIPDTPLAAIIWIAIALIVVFGGVIIHFLRTMTNSKEIITIFSKSLGETQQSFKEESVSARAAHALSIERMLLSNAAVHAEQGRLLEKTVAEHGRLLERSVDRITSSLDDLKGMPRPRRLKEGE